MAVELRCAVCGEPVESAYQTRRGGTILTCWVHDADDGLCCWKAEPITETAGPPAQP